MFPVWICDEHNAQIHNKHSISVWLILLPHFVVINVTLGIYSVYAPFDVCMHRWMQPTCVIHERQIASEREWENWILKFYVGIRIKCDEWPMNVAVIESMGTNMCCCGEKICLWLTSDTITYVLLQIYVNEYRAKQLKNYWHEV